MVYKIPNFENTVFKSSTSIAETTPLLLIHLTFNIG